MAPWPCFVAPVKVRLPTVWPPPHLPACAESITKTKAAIELLKKIGAFADVEKAKVGGGRSWQ